MVVFDYYGFSCRCPVWSEVLKSGCLGDLKVCRGELTGYYVKFELDKSELK